MGRVVLDMDTPIRKTTSGLIVLPTSHLLVRRKQAPLRREVLIGSSVCCACRMCTDLCPRFLLGHELHPHMVMRSMMHGSYLEPLSSHVTNAYLCCDCGVCELVACPLALSPRKVNMALRDKLLAAGVSNPHRRREVHPEKMRRFRHVPLDRLLARTDLTRFAQTEVVYDRGEYEVSLVRLPMDQHIGAPAKPVVRAGDRLRRGDVVGEIPDSQLGARVHASMDGIVVSASATEVVVGKEMI